jgi:fumarylacetoacetase
MIDRTHDPALRSWVESANQPGCDFPIQNLPFATFRHFAGTHVGVAIGDRVLDVTEALQIRSMRGLMAMPRPARVELRREIQDLLVKHATGIDACMLPLAEAELLLPCEIGDYTDFYASIHHATNVGSMFRPDNPLLPNYKWLPVGYHGRASSIVVSGTAVRRPRGQTTEHPAGPPAFTPTRRLDYELEVGAFLGPGNAAGEPIPAAQAGDHLFGVCLLNDWSARDIQTWEYQPLGPFLSKSFATSISPWVVTMEALEPFRRSPEPRPASDPQPLPHLRTEADPREPLAVRLPVLDAFPDGGAPRLERLSRAPGRPDRQRHGLRSGEGKSRLPAGVDLARRRAVGTSHGRGPEIPGGRRRGDAARLVRGSWIPPDRAGGMPRKSSAGRPGNVKPERLSGV